MFGLLPSEVMFFVATHSSTFKYSTDGQILLFMLYSPSLSWFLWGW
jgi:hypothetical protein